MAEGIDQSETNYDSIFDSKACLFCSQKFCEANPSVSPDLSKLDKLFDACKTRNDIIGKSILAHSSEIKQGLCKLCYHKNCKATYQSKHHIQRALKQKGPSEEQIKDRADQIKSSSTRSSTQFFDWKHNCFICGEVCDSVRNESKASGSWSMVASAIGDGKNDVYKRVVEAAEKRNDFVVLNRLRGLPNGDLVAAEARYHRKKSCLLKYTSERSIHYDTKDSSISFKYANIGLQLKAEYENSIMEENQVVELSTIRERFKELALEAGLDDIECYKTNYIKNLLTKLWPELSFIYRPGLTDLVCSNKISVGEALHMADQLFKLNQSLSDDDTCAESSDIESEDAIVHKAVGILRNSILRNTVNITDHYYSPDEMNLPALQDFVDPLLYKTMGWLVSNERFANASDISTEPPDVNCLTIACDITKAVTSIASPKHLGLAVHLHNEYGSRRLIEEMANLGYTITYPEMRRFLTSAASFITSTQPSTPSGGIVSSEITPVSRGGKLILGAADNWDHNERTVDGKRTTHAMTSIIVSPKIGEKVTSPRLPRIKDRSFDVSSVPGGGLSYVVPYRKPQKRPEPIFATPVTDSNEITVLETPASCTARVKELLYNIGRCDIFYEDVADNMQSELPPWSVFHSLLNQDNSLPVCNVSFNPILMATPTDYSTIYTTLMRMKETINALGQLHAPVFFDMGLLSKAFEIVWARKEELSGIIPCEGGMHLLMSVFAGIGHIYGDAGMKQLLSDSDVYAPGTVQMILAGKDFDRALMAFRLIDEVLHDRLLRQFNEWLSEKDKDIDATLSQDLSNIRDMIRVNGNETDKLLKALCDKLQQGFLQLLQEFKDEGSSKSPTFKFWIDYLDRVSVPLKLFISSSRRGDWETHQYAKECLLPLLYASNRTIYSRYMTVVLLQMKRLPDEVLNAFQEGLFVAKLSEGSFNSVWMDYVLETTENKSLKGAGGIIGMTLKGNALARWFLSRPVTAKYSMEFQERISSGSGSSHQSNKLKTHHTDSKAQSVRYNESVDKIVKKFDNGIFIDPFDLKSCPDNLVNIATGEEASLEVQESLTSYLVKGETMMKKFVEDRLITDENGTPNKSFFDPLQKSNIKTMTDTRKHTQIKSKTVLIDADVMFQRLLAVNAYKKVPAERVLSFENTPVPVSLFDESGRMLTSKKSDFMHKLEDLLEANITSVDSADCVVFDGMAVVQMLPVPTVTATYRDMAVRFFQYVLKKAHEISPAVQQIHIVFDRYMEDSLKKHTRMKRGDTVASRSVHIVGEQTVPSVWKNFLSSGSNKDRLVKYYTGFVQENSSSVLKDEVLYITTEERVIRVTVDNVTVLDELKSTHEEADTRMFLHIAYAVEHGATSTVVCSPDTDVLVLMMHHYSDLHCIKLYMLTGHTGKHTDLSRFIPIHELCNVLTESQLQIMLSVYCLTGCDTTSGLFGKGKKTVFNQLMQNPEEYTDLRHLGSTLELSEKHRRACCKFIASLYGKKNSLSLNSLRAEKAKSLKAKKLPPTDNSFRLHCLRCVYQLYIWRHALQPEQQLESPSEFGFEYDNVMKCWQPTMVTQPVAAPELINDIVCQCEEVCDEDCTCSISRQPCTVACACKAAVPTEAENDISMCTNVHTILSVMLTEENDSDSD